MGLERVMGFCSYAPMAKSARVVGAVIALLLRGPGCVSGASTAESPVIAGDAVSEASGGGESDARPELVLADLDDCVSTPAAGGSGVAYVTSPQGWQIRTAADPNFECGDQFSTVEYRPGLVAVINVQSGADGKPASQQVSGFAAAVRGSWRKSHQGENEPKLLGHKVGRDDRPAVCLELPELDDDAVKIGCVTAQAGPDKTLIYHYASFYLKLADFEANRDAAWEEVRTLSGEWVVLEE